MSTPCSPGSVIGPPQCEIGRCRRLRGRTIDQAQLDFQDFAIVGDAQWTFADGVLTLTVDLRPE